MNVLTKLKDQHPLHVFTYEGNPIGQVNTKAWRNALLRAEIHDFRRHDLRHTFATWHREAGTPTHELQLLGGWKTQSMVERYAHVAPEGLQFAAMRLDGLLQSTSDSPSKSSAME
jgi:integrase